MKLKLILVKDLLDLAIHEVYALLEVSNTDYDVIEIWNNEMIVKVNSIPKELCRACLVKEIYINGKLFMKFDRGVLMKSKFRSNIPPHYAPLEALISRLLINLARVREGSLVLDPFSGVGGILIEAKMVGAEVVGIDLSLECLKVLRKNIPNSSTVLSDTVMMCIKDNSIDAIVTDPPYGRLSITEQCLEKLYENFSEIAYKVLKKNHYLAISQPCYVHSIDYFLSAGFELVCIGLQRKHGALTRAVMVFRKT